jgi:hypothetical protein
MSCGVFTGKDGSKPSELFYKEMRKAGMSGYQTFYIARKGAKTLRVFPFGTTGNP